MNYHEYQRCTTHASGAVLDALPSQGSKQIKRGNQFKIKASLFADMPSRRCRLISLVARLRS